MPYLVQLPTGQRVQFPDEVSREEAYRIITEQYYPDQSPLMPPPAPPTTIGGELMEVLKGLPRGAAGLLETAAAGAAAILPEQAERELRGEITEFFQPVREALTPAAGYEESIGARAGEALGSTLPFLAAGPLGVAGRIGATGLGVAAGAGEARLRAEQEGGMEDRGAATALGALVGATEVIPILRILNRLPEKEVLGALDYVKRAAAAGGEEFAQEASANVAQNLIEKGLYNPEQEVFEGAAEEGAYGFGVGAFIQGLTDLAMGRHVRGGVEPPGGEDERAGIGAEQTLAGADTGGIDLPVSRIGAAGPDIEGIAADGMGIPSDIAGRVDEGAEALQPALEPARFQMDDDVPRPWYYSELLKQTQNAPIKSAPAAQWLGTLKSKGVKDEEVEFTGLGDWLKTQEGNVSKEDVLNFVQNNGVQLDEVTFGGGMPYQVRMDGIPLESFATREQAQEFVDEQVRNYTYDTDFEGMLPAEMEPGTEEANEYLSSIIRDYRNGYRVEFDESAATGDVGPAKYTGYKHPFGDNYREFVIRVPQVPVLERQLEKLETDFAKLSDEITSLRQERTRLREATVFPPDYQETYDNLFNVISEKVDQRAELHQRIADLRDNTTYTEGHWGDYGTNAVAHFRASDMDDGKTFMVHEMQSQLAQLGRDKGFIGQDTEPKMAAILAEKIDLEGKSFQINQNINLLEEELSGQRDAMRRFENVLRDMTKTDDAPYGRSISVDFVTDPEIIAAYESGQSPAALIKTSSGGYLGVIDDDKVSEVAGYLTEGNVKVGDRVVEDNPNVPRSEQHFGTIIEVYPRARGGSGVRIQWDAGYVGAYSLSNNEYNLKKVDSKSTEQAVKDSLLTQQEYDAITQPVANSLPFRENLYALKALVTLDPNIAKQTTNRLIQERDDLETKISEIDETYDLSSKRFNVPKFPFTASTDKWQNLLLKRILKHAVDNGYERIMFPQGQEAKSYTMGDLRGQEYFYDIISPKNIKEIATKYKGKVTFSKVPSPWTLEQKVKSAIEKELDTYPTVAGKFERQGQGVTAKKRRDTARTRLLNLLRDRNLNFASTPIDATESVLESEFGIGNLNTPEGEATMRAILDFHNAVMAYGRESKPGQVEGAADTRTVIEITPEMRSKLYEPLPLFRMGKRSIRKPMSVAAAQKVINDLSKGWANKPNIKVVATHKDLPKPYRLDKYKNVKGMLLGNDVYIVASNAGSPSDIKATLFHESLGHYGLRDLFRTRFDEVLSDIYKTNTAVRKAADEWLTKYPDVYQGRDRTARAVEEILAAKSEKGVIKEPGIRAAFNRLAAMIRKFLRAMGFVTDYSNNDINNIVLEAAERVRSQPGPVFNTYGSPRFQVSQYTKTLANVLEQNQKLPQWSQAVGDGVANAMSRMPENLRKTQFYIYSMPQTIELLERYVPRIRAIDRFIGYRASYTTDLMKTASDNHAKYSEAIQAYPDKFDEFNNVVNDINLFQVEVRDQAVIDLLSQPRASLSPQKQKYYDVAKRFYALPPRLQNAILTKDGTGGLFADYRKMGDKKFEIFSQVYGGQLGMGVVKDLRERFEKERLPMYAPLVRGEGAHWLYYETTDGRQSKEVFPSEAAREVAIRKAIEEGRAKADTIVRATRASEIRDKGPPPTGFLAQVIDRLESTMPNTIPADVRRQIIDGVYDTFISSLPSEMLRQELSSRQTFDVDGAMQFGVLGFDQDVLAVYERQMPKMAYQLGNLKFALPIENAMKKVMEQAKLYEIAVRENNLPQRLQGRKLMSPKAVYDGVEDMRRRLDFAYNPTYAPWVNGIATANYIYSIAGNVSSALINTTVLLMMTFPSLVGKYGTAKSIAAMTRAMKMFAEGGVDDQGNFTFGNAATGEMKTFFDYLTKRGVIGIAAEQELRQAQRAKISGYQTTLDKLNYVMGYVFKNSERFNREVTMLASFMLAREKGKSFKTAAEEAIRLNNNINGTVLPESASRLYQTNLGRVILTFRTFALTQIINLSRMFGRALNAIDATPEERNIARKQMLGVFGMTYMVAGIKGLPLFSAAEVLAAALMGDDDEPYDLQQEVLDSMGLLGLNGPLNAAFNVDIASRTGFNGMLWRDDPKRLAQLGYVYYAIDRIAGPTAGLVEAQVRGFGKLADGDIQRGFESILPAPIRNPLKAARYATEGALTKNGQPIVDSVDTWNQVMQIFGFAPAELAATQEQIGAKFAISDKLRNRRTALLTNLYTAITTGDSQATDEAFEAINNFNAANPMISIDSRSITASFRERSRRAGESINGIYLPQKLLLTTEEYMADLN